jgi:uncharacterized membrane protein YphA (DoxX/SURF4 family)
MTAATIIGVMRLLATQAAAFLALLLIASAIHKIVRPARTREVMQEFAGVPPRFAYLALIGVPLAELVAGCGLAVPTGRTAAAMLAALIWSGYLLLILRAILQGRRYVDCGCSFGPSLRPLGTYQTLRGVVLIGLASLVAALPPDPSATLTTASELLAAAAFLGLYAALDEALAVQPLRLGERR